MYLLVAAALPVWLAAPLAPPPLGPALFAGILAVVVGDGVAAVAGTQFGRTFLPGARGKTLEGVAASIAAQATMYALCLVMFGGEKEHLLRTAAALVVGAFAEAYTTQVDNLVLPVIVLGLFPG